MSNVYILIEQALGYCLLKANSCKSSDDLVVLLQDKNLENIKSKLKLAEFQPFASVNNASLNCQDIANGNANEDLIDLLKRHLSNGKCTLVVSDRKLLESLKAANVNDSLEFNADSAMILHLRRVRHSIHEFMGDSEQHILRAHIGLGHSFSRMKIKFNVNRADNMIIQSINLLDQLDKDINTMAMRLREWFGYHYPELVKLATDNRSYSTVVCIIGSRAGATEEVLERLETAIGDSDRARQIIVTARTSMGYELTEEDLLNIGFLATKTLSMMTQREDTAKYLSSKMAQVAPNFSTLVGDIVAARLISHAGSLINLAKFPASTIQILGAEKALFRALKTRTNTPKYGLIFHSSFIGRAAKNDKGRISRFLAAKISLAVRLDCFMEEPMNIFGLHLKKQVEDQLKYLETGEEPKKNYEAMDEAVKDAKRYISEMKVTQDLLAAKAKTDEIKQEKKKDKAPKEELVENKEDMETKKDKKNKKSKKNKSEIKEEQVIKKEEEVIVKVEEVTAENGDSKKKKKSKKDKNELIEEKVVKEEETIARTEENTLAHGESKKKKSKKDKSKKDKSKTAEEKDVIMEEVIVVKTEDTTLENGESKKKKKSKKDKSKAAEEKDVIMEEAIVEKTEDTTLENSESKKKKKSKKDKSVTEEKMEIVIEMDQPVETPKKKSKKRASEAAVAIEEQPSPKKSKKEKKMKTEEKAVAEEVKVDESAEKKKKKSKQQ